VRGWPVGDGVSIIRGERVDPCAGIVARLVGIFDPQ
jgi:hypothetical protein